MKRFLLPFALALGLLAVAPRPADAAVALTVNRVSTHGKFVIMSGTLVFSGSYPTGGETLNLNGLQIPGTVPPRMVLVTGETGAGYAYTHSAASRSAGKVKVFVEQTVGTNTLLAEHTAATYVAGVTSDTVKVMVWFDLLR